MNSYDPWGKKPGGNNAGGFGSFGSNGGAPTPPKPGVYRPAGQPNFGAPTTPPNPGVYRPAGQPNFGAPTTPPRPGLNRPAGQPAFGAPASPKPIHPTTQLGGFTPPAAAKPAVKPTAPFGSFGAPGVPPSRFNAPAKHHNFWGDIDGDGKETDWDDVLGDGLLEEAMMAEDRARRGVPPEPEDEFLIGRRADGASRPAAGSASGSGALVAAVLILGLFGMVVLAVLLSVVH